MFRRNGRRRSFRRKRTVHRRRGFRSVRRVVRRTVRNMAETKFNTQSIDTVGITASGAFLSFADGLVQGTGSAQRIGNRIEVKALTFRLGWAFISGVPAEPLPTSRRATCRLMVLFPRKGLTSQDVQNAVNAASNPVYDRIDPTKVIMMYDRLFTIGGANPTNSNGSERTEKFFRFFKRTKFQFNYNNANAIDREPNVYMVSTISSTDTSGVTVNGYMTMSFKDM